MDRDKIFIKFLVAIVGNNGIVKNKNDLNYDSGRKQVIDMAKMMTNIALEEIKEEDED